MTKITEFDDQFSKLLPGTVELLRSANLCVHPRVTQVTLHGSRGLVGGARPDSDLDLGLLVSSAQQPIGLELDRLLRAVLETTLEHWESDVEPDVTVVFDIRECGLRCFRKSTFEGKVCDRGGPDCFGLYKIQRGFNGFVMPVSKELARMYPCITVWERTAADDLYAA
jgi:hypothetical protein